MIRYSPLPMTTLVVAQRSVLFDRFAANLHNEFCSAN